MITSCWDALMMTPSNRRLLRAAICASVWSFGLFCPLAFTTALATVNQLPSCCSCTLFCHRFFISTSKELQARSSTSSKRDLQRQSTSDPRQVMSSLLLSPIDPASRTYCDQSWEVTEVIDEAGLSHGLAEDEASQSAMAWHESPSGGASLWQDCHKDGHGVTHGESVAGGGVTGCNIGSGDDTADRACSWGSVAGRR